MINYPDFNTIPPERWGDALNETLKRLIDEVNAIAETAKSAKNASNPEGNMYVFKADKTRKLPQGFMADDTITKLSDLIIARKR